MAKKAELSFEEFRALRRRRAHDEEDLKPREIVTEVAPEEKKKDDEGIAVRAGRLVEMEEVQALSSGLIVADTLALIIQALGYADEGILKRLLDTFTGFTAFALLFELVALATAFGSAFWRHPGYLLDSFVVATCLRIEMNPGSSMPALRLLGIIRLWRLYRLHETIVARIRGETNDTNALLQAERAKCLRLELDIATAETSVRQAHEAKLRLEHMCKAYKDEIDTLNEALAIAAMDVAEAGDDELNSDTEDDGPPHSLGSTKERSQSTNEPPSSTATFVVDPSGNYHRTEEKA